jgi:hypothetical protein
LIALEGEIGSAMNVETLGWQRTTTGDSAAVFTGVEIWMGLCDQDQLGWSFQDNYIPGTRTLVFEDPDFTASGDEMDWFTIDLENPFWYEGDHNLLVEIVWTSGTGSFHTWKWNDPGVPRALKSPEAEGDTGFLSSEMSQLLIEGTTGLEEGTFGRIKILLGGSH